MEDTQPVEDGPGALDSDPYSDQYSIIYEPIEDDEADAA